MASEWQAEQSATEVFLRETGLLTAVPAEQLTIQPYRGGSFGKTGKPYLYTSRLASDLLRSFAHSLPYMGHPAYYTKVNPNKGKCS